MDGWITCNFMSFQQYFSHIRMMVGDNERLCAMEPHFVLGCECLWRFHCITSLNLICLKDRDGTIQVSI